MLDTSIQLMFLYFRGLRTIFRTDGPLDFNLVGVLDLGMYILCKTRMVKWLGDALEFLFGVTVPHSDSISTFLFLSIFNFSDDRSGSRRIASL